MLWTVAFSETTKERYGSIYLFISLDSNISNSFETTERRRTAP